MNVEQLIKEKIRQNVIYIDFPPNIKLLAKFISALANKEGGIIVLGVYDDGFNLHIKDYPFIVDKVIIQKYISQSINMELRVYNLNNKTIKVIQVEKSEILLKIEGVIYMYRSNGSIDEFKEKRIFLSYSHNESKIASLIQKRFESKCKEKIIISRDIDRLKYKDSLKEYMDTIKNHDFVISIVSDKYLKSQACMYEILELMRDSDYYEKLLFMVISDADEDTYFEDIEEQIKPNLYNADRFNYLTYWQKELEKLKNIEKQIDNPAHKTELVREIKEIELITINIGNFIEKLKDGIGRSVTELIENDFEQFYNIILE